MSHEKNSRSASGSAARVVIRRADRHGTHSLDSHTADQRRFRAFLALMLLNDSVRARAAGADDVLVTDNHRAVAGWDLGQWERDYYAFASQQDELIVLSDVPRRFADVISVRLDGPRPRGIPGIRLLTRHPDGMWFRFWHPPTQGLLQTRSTTLPMVRPYTTATRLPQARRTLPAPPRLADAEVLALRVMSRMYPDVQHLLAGLLARLSCGDQAGVATAVSGSSSTWGSVRLWYSLWGKGAHWTLRGGSELAAAGLAAVLTDPMVGMTGASIASYVDDVITVRYQCATLELIGKPV